jgi:hypothetical protein
MAFSIFAERRIGKLRKKTVVIKFELEIGAEGHTKDKRPGVMSDANASLAVIAESLIETPKCMKEPPSPGLR